MPHHQLPPGTHRCIDAHGPAARKSWGRGKKNRSQAAQSHNGVSPPVVGIHKCRAILGGKIYIYIYSKWIKNIDLEPKGHAGSWPQWQHEYLCEPGVKDGLETLNLKQQRITKVSIPANQLPIDTDEEEDIRLAQGLGEQCSLGAARLE